MLRSQLTTAPATAREECRFLDGPGPDDSLYARIYLPSAETARRTGVVIAPPVGHERLRCYRELVVLGRSLAKVGYPVIHADYRGEGESSGNFADCDLTTRVADLERETGELRAVARLKRLAIVGVRLGTVVALLAAERIEASALALVEPVTNPAMCARDLLRANVILQRQYQGGIRRNATELRAALQAGETISIYGFHLGLPLLTGLEDLQLSPSQQAFSGHALVLHFEREAGRTRPDLEEWRAGFLRAAGGAELAEVVTSFTWAGKNAWSSGIEPLHGKLVGWLESDG